MGLINLTSFVGDKEKKKLSAADSIFAAASTTLATTDKPARPKTAIGTLTTTLATAKTPKSRKSSKIKMEKERASKKNKNDRLSKDKVIPDSQESILKYKFSLKKTK